MDLNWCLLICDLLVSVLTLICNLMGLKLELVNSITHSLKFVETRAASQIITMSISMSISMSIVSVLRWLAFPTFNSCVP